MKIIELELQAREPLVITDGSAEGMAHSCLDYIPGSQLLGAFASLWICAHPGLVPDDSPEFQKLFLDGSVSWGCAYPLCSGKKCAPVPHSFRREKNMAGLPLEGKYAPRGSCEIFNVAALKEGQTLESCWKTPGKDEGAPPKFKRLAASFMQPETMRQPLLPKVWNTRVALDKERRAQESQLFGFLALAAGTTFYSEIYCHDAQACDLLRQLFAKNETFYAGHARSAGYGKISLTSFTAREGAPQERRASVLNIYLLSDYLPMPAWEEPRANLLQALEDKFGQKLDVASQFITYKRIEGFDSHWHRWRDGRMALQAGSVLKVTAPEEFSFSAFFSLGADQREGYGRILLNPPFLEELVPAIPEKPETAAPKPAPPIRPDMQSPVWNVLKERALERIAQNQALLWLHDERWQRFLESARHLDRPTASQRANLRAMSLEDFKTLIDKSAGDQWTTQYCANPFGSGNEYLHKIMYGLLDAQTFLRRFPLEEKLPWEGAERELSERAWRLFRHELLRAWGKNVRIRQKEGAGS